MSVKTLWGSRVQEYYRKMFRYYAIIGANVFYFFLIIGSVLIYFFHLFVQWLPPELAVEVILSLIVTYILTQTKVRTFVEKADIPFLLPLESRLTPYFIRSLLYSWVIDVSKLVIFLTIFISLFLDTTSLHLLFLLFIVAIAGFNIVMKWIEQWLENRIQLLLHRLNRFLLLYFMVYFLLKDDWMYVLIFMSVHVVYILYFMRKRRTLNWLWQIDEEERGRLKNLRFINFFIDVPSLKHSFRRRRLLTMIVQKCIPTRQSRTFIYLYAQLFVRHNDYFYLYLRLTLISIVVNFALPTSGWVFHLLIVYMTASQIIPLQHQLKQTAMLYPISKAQIKASFLKFVLIILYVQLFIVSVPLFIHLSIASVFGLVIGSLFVYVFVNHFLSKRVNVLESTFKE
ncbi:ABC transporter permease [Geomicrobium sp. JSM 1781026]